MAHIIKLGNDGGIEEYEGVLDDPHGHFTVWVEGGEVLWGDHLDCWWGGAPLTVDEATAAQAAVVELLEAAGAL